LAVKKFVNRPADVVEEMLDGLVILHPGLVRLAGHKVITRANADQTRQQQVAILSGGGSGHEPAHAGYVGDGMLSAAVAGEVFTSPSGDSVYAAIKAVAGKPGALLVVKNYTGDRLNFGLAAEMARAEGIPVELVVVDDDVALLDSANATGARGLAGTVFIHKLVGAAASEGKNLAEIAATGRDAVKALATMGVSFSAGTAPAVGKPSFELAENEMELGLGIHGEPGAQRTEIQAADNLTETLLTEILKRGNFGLEKRVAVMINNLGATTEMELAITARHASQFLEKNGLNVERIYAGTFLSSLDMAGISISVLGLNDQWVRWLDADTAAPAWPNAAKQRPGKLPAAIAREAGPKVKPPSSKAPQSEKTRMIARAIEAACRALIHTERELTELDRITGDGDLGVSMERAAKAVRTAMDSYPLNNVPDTVKALGHTLRKELGGSSGPLYGILFLRCGSVLETARWPEAILEGCRAVSELGGAKLGDRTMLDALIPFAEELQKTGLTEAVAAADRGVEATAKMKPRLGRSSYLGDRVLGHPDPGARAVAIWLHAVSEIVGG
jgi:triose/dihydroxyacetone kinase / FAD-AMP lyase (cyclizing)